MFFHCWFTWCTDSIFVKSTLGTPLVIELWVLYELCFWCLPQQMRLSVFAAANIARVLRFRFRRFLLQLRPKAYRHLLQTRRGVSCCFVLA